MRTFVTLAVTLAPLPAFAHDAEIAHGHGSPVALAIVAALFVWALLPSRSVR